MLCEPSGNWGKVVFPEIATFAFPSMLKLVQEVGSFTVNVNEMSVSEYVSFFGEATTMVGDVLSDGGDKGFDG